MCKIQKGIIFQRRTTLRFFFGFFGDVKVIAFDKIPLSGACVFSFDKTNNKD